MSNGHCPCKITLAIKDLRMRTPIVQNDPERYFSQYHVTYSLIKAAVHNAGGTCENQPYSREALDVKSHSEYPFTNCVIKAIDCESGAQN